MIQFKTKRCFTATYLTCMVLVVSFSSCSKVDLNGLTGTYVGEACAGGFVSDSISGTQYVANCNQDFVKVIIDPDRDDKLRIVYNGNRDVTIDNNLNFDDSKGCTGKFNGDSLMINYEPNWTQSYWFRGKKQ